MVTEEVGSSLCSSTLPKLPPSFLCYLTMPYQSNTRTARQAPPPPSSNINAWPSLPPPRSATFPQEGPRLAETSPLVTSATTPHQQRGRSLSLTPASTLAVPFQHRATRRSLLGGGLLQNPPSRGTSPATHVSLNDRNGLSRLPSFFQHTPQSSVASSPASSRSSSAGPDNRAPGFDLGSQYHLPQNLLEQNPSRQNPSREPKLLPESLRNPPVPYLPRVQGVPEWLNNTGTTIPSAKLPRQNPDWKVPPGMRKSWTH